MAIGALIMPWKLLESTNGYIFVWLTGYGALLGPITGIMIADYWIVRRTSLAVDALYQQNGVYRYAKGWNPAAMIAFLVPVAINMPGFLHSALPQVFSGVAPFWIAIYGYAWFVGIGLALVIYSAMMWTHRTQSVPSSPAAERA